MIQDSNRLLQGDSPVFQELATTMGRSMIDGQSGGISCERRLAAAWMSRGLDDRAPAPT
ncbi:hypothetical protein NITLEN_11004 [Nitrospira lenta]|uniref:Uncharacterized protein n=1 Tax=Nitrospira lenta TaxID=1436998 RepID=A0A330L2D1_9BACT|nr:hypothetical protein NITLEN_11004 [Nitrospira lenta]